MKINKYIKYAGLIAIIALYCTSCNTSQKNKLTNTTKADGLITIDIDTIQIQDEIILSKLFSNIECVALETNSNCIIGQIDHIQIFDKTIFVLDRSVSKTVFAFDINGKFLWKYGSIGKGPGEYFNPNHFSINETNGNVLILDVLQKKICTYDYYGNFLFDFKIEPQIYPIQIALLNNQIYFDLASTAQRESDFLLSSTNFKGENIFKALPYDIYAHGFKKNFSTGESFYKTDHDLKFSKPFFDTIFSITDNIIKPFLSIKTSNTITKDEIEKINNSKNYVDTYSRSERFLGMSHYVENDNMIHFRVHNNGFTSKLFLFPNSNSWMCGYRLIDDLTYYEFGLDFMCGYNNQFVSCIQNKFSNSIEKFIENSKANIIKITDKEKLMVSKLNSSSNPIIVFYECRKNVFY